MSLEAVPPSRSERVADIAGQQFVFRLEVEVYFVSDGKSMRKVYIRAMNSLGALMPFLRIEVLPLQALEFGSFNGGPASIVEGFRARCPSNVSGYRAPIFGAGDALFFAINRPLAR